MKFQSACSQQRVLINHWKLLLLFAIAKSLFDIEFTTNSPPRVKTNFSMLVIPAEWSHYIYNNPGIQDEKYPFPSLARLWRRHNEAIIKLFCVIKQTVLYCKGCIVQSTVKSFKHVMFCSSQSLGIYQGVWISLSFVYFRWIRSAFGFYFYFSLNLL